jgi:hypothetical protein
MPTKIHRNTFTGGMSKDTDPKQVKPNQYEDAFNISVSQDGREGQAATFKGVQLKQVILSAIGTDHSVIKIMGVYEAEVTLDGGEELMALVFGYNTDDSEFYVWAIEQDGTLHTPYTETISAEDDAKLDASGQYFADCVVYGEGGTNHAYFTNGVSPMMKLPLVITTAGKGSTTPYYREEIILIRSGVRGGITPVTGLSVSSGSGRDLLAGTYQFVVRLINTTQNKKTKWGKISQPVFIGIDATTTSKSYGGVGFASTSGVDIHMTWLTNYTTNSLYTHYQIAVIENINGDAEGSLVVKVLQPETLSASTDTYEYYTNKRAIDLIDIADLTVDDAAIRAVNTLRVKNNRLITGNIEYHALDYNHPSGDPEVGTGTEPLNHAFDNEKATAYANPDNATNYVGHFRDELYRYGVVYEDEFGNFSKPKILNFDSANVPANSAASESPDFRFPARNNSKYGVLMQTDGDIQALGLSIKNLKNHPTWAKAVHIVRVPRKKRVLFQTPIVPSILVQPAKADGSYPDQRYDANEAGEIPVLNVSAANPDGTFMPKNFFHILPKNLLRFGDLKESTAAVGSVYGTHGITDFGYGAIKTDGSANGTFYLMQRTTEGLMWQSTANDNGVKFQREDEVIKGTYRDFVSGDAVTALIERRAKGTTAAWTSDPLTPSVPYTSTTFDFNLTTYDYRVTFTK